MAFSVPWEWTQLKAEYGFLELPGESTASCQGQGVSERGPAALQPGPEPPARRARVTGGVHEQQL